MSSPKVWLVTGSSTGLGNAVVQQALSNGDNVVATLRKPEVLSDLALKYTSQLLLVKVDVTKLEEIKSAFVTAHEKFGRVDVVYNNAGAINHLCVVEGTSEDQARDLFEVNFWGASNVTREAIKFFRDVNRPCGGHLLQASSLSGITGNQMVTYYCATKFALEGFTEGIAKELDPSWNIKITLLAMGGFQTPGIGPEKMAVPPPPPGYEKSSIIGRDFFEYGAANFGKSDKAAREIYKIGNQDQPPFRVILGQDSLAATKAKAEALLEQVEKSAEYSADLK
ncbi:NAD-P-binding protein [Cyathus striatus]|nr:NAD-P-binding protein [Cyathus striatus]